MRAYACSTADTLFTLETSALGMGKHRLLIGSVLAIVRFLCPLGKWTQVSQHSCITSHDLRSGVCGIKSQCVLSFFTFS